MSELKPRLKALYFRLIDALHRPFVRPGMEDPYHVLFRDFLARARELPSPAVLEIGSRIVTGVTRRGLFPNAAEFVGFDVLAGQGVDVVGDAHRLASFLPPEHFDVVFAISVFEHLLFPWKVVMEVNAVTKPGGLVFVSTHPAWPAHELPWDFWRYQPAGLHALFHHATGFELLAVSDGLPCKIYSLVDDPPTRPMHTQSLNQGVAALAWKIGRVRDDLLRWELDPSEVIDTMYPANRRKDDEGSWTRARARVCARADGLRGRPHHVTVLPDAIEWKPFVAWWDRGSRRRR